MKPSKYMNLADIKPNPDNTRLIKDHKFKKLCSSITDFPKMMAIRPIVINSENMVLGGNMRLQALKHLKFTDVPNEWVKVAEELTEEEQKRFIIEYNMPFGEWDFDILANEFELPDLIDWGFEVTDFDLPKPEIEEDEVPEVKEEPVSQLGDLYLLGKHRLLCGDSTNTDDVKRLMDGDKATITFTSPPYNLGVSASLRGNTKIGKRGNVYEQYDDNATESDWLELMNKFTSIALSNSKYVFVNVQSLAGNRTALPKWWNQYADQYCDVVIWDKGHAAPQQAQRVMNSCFEFVFIYTNDNANRAIRTAPEFRGTVKNVYVAPPQRDNQEADTHGATFPVHLHSYFIQTFTETKTSVYDPFGGSGTTLIACEQLDRTCYMMEIDPRYIDVIVTRWETLTGQKAVKANAT